MEFNLNLSSFTSESNFHSLDLNKIYDVLIIGGGPAGLTAAVYCMRKGLNTGIIVKDIGGQVADTATVENYMGYRYISGIELVNKFKEQVTQFGIDFEENLYVTKVEHGSIKKILLNDGRLLQAKSLIIASGKESRKLNIPGEKELTGKGVAYCAICDAPLFKDKKVVVVGGGNSGIEAAIDLAKVGKSVFVVQFLETLTADKILVERLNDFTNVEIAYKHEVVEIKGSNTVESVIIKNRDTNDTRDVEAEGVFVEIGLIPNTDFIKGVVNLNEYGEIIIDSACRTSKPGIFAAGDVTSVLFKQIIVAGGEGAKAALSASDYVLKEHD